MTFTLIVEQLLNGLQFGLMLFLIAAGLYWFVTRTRAGVLVRAGASNRQMATLMGVRVPLL